MILNHNFLNQNPGLAAALATDHVIVRNIAESFKKFGRLSDKQIALVMKLANEASQPAVVAAPSEWVGTVGKRQRFTLKLEKQIRIETQWGTSYLHMFSDDDGNSFKWFSSAGMLRTVNGSPVEVNDVVMVMGTVKGHETYNGRKQTSLSRVKL